MLPSERGPRCLAAVRQGTVKQDAAAGVLPVFRFRGYPRTMKRTRVRAREIVGGLERRGVTRTVGAGKATRRALL
jgi:hypothetical protein